MRGYYPGVFFLFQADMIELVFIVLTSFAIGLFCWGLANKNKLLWFAIGFAFNIYGLFLLMIMYNSHLKVWLDSIEGPQYNNSYFK